VDREVFLVKSADNKADGTDWRTPIVDYLRNPSVRTDRNYRRVDRRVNCRCVSQPGWVSARRDTKGGESVRGTRGLRVVLRPGRMDVLAVGGYKRSRGREREPYALARPPARPTFFVREPWTFLL
jgi:hypothetical protein